MLQRIGSGAVRPKRSGEVRRCRGEAPRHPARAHPTTTIRVTGLARAAFVVPAALVAFTGIGFADPPSTPFDPSGHWEGAIALPGTELSVLVDLTVGPEALWSGTIDIPLQGAQGLALENIAVQGDSIRFAISGVPGTPTFTGTGQSGRIEGQFTQGGQTFPFHLGREKVDLPKRPQEPQPPFPYRSEDVTYTNGDLTLAGTLTLPEGDGPFPAALLVTGSGPQNRDEEILGHKPFLVLADHLTRAGIAVLRVDDRGVGGSGGSTSESTTEDFAGDALAGVAFLRARPEIRPAAVGIIGHSEGAVVGPLAASRAPDVAFVVMLAGTGVPGAEVILRQSEAIRRAMGADEVTIAFEQGFFRQTFALYAADADSSEIRRSLAEWSETEIARQAGADTTLRATLEAVRDGALATGIEHRKPWFDFFIAYDPRPALRAVTVPVLVLNGEKDLQVLPDQNLPEIEAALAAAGNRDVTVRRLPGLNHLFQPAETGSPLEYGTIETTMDPVVLDAVATWILELQRPAQPGER